MKRKWRRKNHVPRKGRNVLNTCLKTLFVLYCAFISRSVWSYEDVSLDNKQFQSNIATDMTLLGGGLLISAGFTQLSPNKNAWIGPKLSNVIDGERPESINRMSTGSTVPTVVSASIFTGSALAATAIAMHSEAAKTSQWPRAFLGLAETLVSTHVLTEGFKLSFGRLRPNFLQVYRSLGCESPEANCDMHLNDELSDVRKSFISGHTSNAFAMAGYGALMLGEAFVWAKNRTRRSKTVALLGQLLLLTGAGWVASTRMTDNKHHLSDVLVGAVIGLGVASTFFLRHHRQLFIQKASIKVQPLIGLQSIGLSIGADF